MFAIVKQTKQFFTELGIIMRLDVSEKYFSFKLGGEIVCCQSCSNEVSVVFLFQIKDAKISDRLTNSPMALVASSYGWSGNMERIMKAQAYAQAKDSNTE